MQKRRRKVKRRRRTYVVEYDIDDYNNKFGVKTANRIIRKRRRKTRKSKKRSTANCARRKQSHNQSDSQNALQSVLSGATSKGLRKEYPRLHLFGDKNALDYFSGESDNDEGIESLNNSIETGDGLLIMSTARSSGHRNLLRRKNVAINSTMESAEQDGGIDILSNIMDTMNRWHSMSQPTTIEKIKINADGSLECNQQPPARTPITQELPNADIQNAPMNARNNGISNRNFNNSNGYRGNHGNQNTGNYSQNRFGGRNEQASFNPFQRGGNFNENNFGNNNFHPNNQSPRYQRPPFQRQRNNNTNNNRFGRNQFQPIQGLYDGEDIIPTPNVPTQCNYYIDIFFFDKWFIINFSNSLMQLTMT